MFILQASALATGPAPHCRGWASQSLSSCAALSDKTAGGYSPFPRSVPEACAVLRRLSTSLLGLKRRPPRAYETNRSSRLSSRRHHRWQVLAVCAPARTCRGRNPTSRRVIQGSLIVVDLICLLIFHPPPTRTDVSCSSATDPLLSCVDREALIWAGTSGVGST